MFELFHTESRDIPIYLNKIFILFQLKFCYLQLYKHQKNMKFISQHKWLEKQVKFNKTQIILPKINIIVCLNNVSAAIDEYNVDCPLEKKIQLIQTIGLNLRNADKGFFNEWSQNLFKLNSFEKVSNIFYGCNDCYQKAFAPNSLRKHYNDRLVELHILNNDKVIHSLEKGKIINPEVYPELVEYFDILTNIDLTGFPELKSMPRKQCKKCK